MLLVTCKMHLHILEGSQNYFMRHPHVSKEGMEGTGNDELIISSSYSVNGKNASVSLFHFLNIFQIIYLAFSSPFQEIYNFISSVLFL